MAILGTFTNKLTTNITTTETIVYTAPNGDACVTGINIASKDDSGVQISIKVTDISENITAYFAKNVPIPTGASLQALDGQKLVLKQGDTISIVCTNNTTNGIDVIISAIEKVNL